MRELLLFFTVALAFVIPAPGKALSSASECDFSSYRPLLMSHALLNATVKRVELTFPGAGVVVAGPEAKVQVKILVDREGNVVEACAVDGHPLLREPARRAALEWKFKRNFGLSRRPKQKYVQSWIVFTFRFNKN